MNYEESDHYHPNNDIYDMDDELAYGHSGEDQFATMSVTSTQDSYVKKNKKLIEDHKKLDKNYHKIKIVAGSFTKKELEIYTSSTNPGASIRNAITGVKFPQYKIGSPAEDLFFKVKLTSHDLKGDEGALFYDSPEQYERHFLCSVDTAIKEKWARKYEVGRRTYLM
jgi:hypothetical protein